jgi:hypothetical protein
MLATGKQIRYRIAAILDAHWEAFVQAEKALDPPSGA